MSHYTVLLDANVLYPAPMRDALMQVAVAGLEQFSELISLSKT